MSSRTARNLVAYIDGRVAVTLKTSADYDFAGVVPDAKSPTGWTLVTRGFSLDSVRSRTRSYWRRWISSRSPVDGRDYRIVVLHPELVKPIAEYFEFRPLPKAPRIMGVFLPGQGWFELGESNEYAALTGGLPTRDRLRHLREQGVTHVMVGNVERKADFSMDELGRFLGRKSHALMAKES